MKQNDYLPSFINTKDILATRLLEQSVIIVQTIREYANRNGIILPENENLNRLFIEAKKTLDELNYIDGQAYSLSRRKVTDFKADDKEPVPAATIYKGAIEKKSQQSKR